MRFHYFRTTLGITGLTALLACGGGGGTGIPDPAPNPTPTPAPTLTSFAPSTGAPGTVVTLTGTNLSGTTAVKFNGLSATAFTIQGATSLTATVPTGATTGAVTVSTPGGTATSAGPFTVLPPPTPAPTISALAPSAGPVGTSVVITGAHFAGATAVTFGGVPAVFAVQGDTQITVTVPAGASTGPVRVTTPQGGADSPVAFTVSAPTGSAPQLDGFTPTAGYTGQIVTLQGSHFTGATSVSFGGRPTLFKVVSDTQILATPPSDAQTGPIGVVNAGGSATSTAAFSVQPPVAELVLAGGFEDAGAGSWASTATAPPYRQIQASAHGGSWYVLLLGNGPDGTEELSQELVLPAGGGAATLSFWTRHTANSTSDPSDTLSVEVRDPAGAVLGTVASFSPADASTTWVKRTADLTAYKGKSLRLVFKAKEKTPAGTSFRLDDVSLSMSAAGVPGTAFDLSLDGAYVVQSTQKLDRSVPLVAGREGWVRVFTTANQPNVAQPPVRVTFKNGAATVGTLTIPAPGVGVPTFLNQGFAAFSYMAKVPAAWVQPGLSLEAVVDPGATLLEASTANNTLSASLDVRTVPEFKVTLFAVTSSTGAVGNVTADNIQEWMDRYRRIYPVQAIDAQFGGSFVTTANLESGDGSEWGAGASELEAKRQADGNGAKRYYVGGVKVLYDSGIAGIANSIPSASTTTGRACIAWDKTGYGEGGNFPDVLAHEVGHTMGRRHSPCGGAGGPDSGYPYAKADIGVYGLDSDTGAIKSPKGYTDVMGYCSPVWISDYVFKKVLDFRASSPVSAVVEAPIESQPCLLVMGLLSNGALELKPAFALRTRPTLPDAGPYTLEGLDAAGRVVISQAFAMQDMEDAGDHADLKNFVFTLPLAESRAAALATLRVRKGEQVLGTRSRSEAALLGAARGIAPRDPEATRMPDGTVYLSWDASRHPLAMIRNAATGEVLGFAKEGGLSLRTQVQDLELLLSDGVQSPRMPVRVRE